MQHRSPQVITTVSDIALLDEYTLKYGAWSAKGVQAYESTRNFTHTLYGGAKGGAKTGAAVRIFQTDISNYRNGLFVVFRRNYTDLRQTTLRTFQKHFPPELLVKDPGKSMLWKCVNNNELLFYAADKKHDPEYEKTKGLEASAIYVDEGTQFDEMFFGVLPTLLWRNVPKHVDTNEILKPYILIGTNPKAGNNYLKRAFVHERTRKKDHNFIKALPEDNPFLDPRYMDATFNNMSEVQRQMLRWGNWDVDISDLVIVPREYLDNVECKQLANRRVCGLGIDVGLGSPDPTVLYACNDQGEMWRLQEFYEYDTTVQENIVLPICMQVRANGGTVHIDAGGVGKGLADNLTKKVGSSVVVHELFGEGAKPEHALYTGKDKERHYQDRRAQMYYWLRLDMYAQRDIGVEYDEFTFEELDNTFMTTNTDKIAIEPKSSIKEKIGRSPDGADALVLCNCARRDRMAREHKIVMPKIPQTSISINTRYRGY